MTSGRTRRWASFLGFSALGACVLGCLEPLYNGPRRPSAEVATLSTNGVFIFGFDGRPVAGRNIGSYELLPGNHVIHVQALSDKPFASGILPTDEVIRVCLKAKAGHRYFMFVRPLLDFGEGGRIVISDSTLGRRVTTPCGPDEDDD